MEEEKELTLLDLQDLLRLQSDLLDLLPLILRHVEKPNELRVHGRKRFSDSSCELMVHGVLDSMNGWVVGVVGCEERLGISLVAAKRGMRSGQVA